jgi:hypothetical protein
MKSFKEYSKSLHGAIASHQLTGHTLHVRKEGTGHYGLYSGGKSVATIFADSESAAIRILRKKGYDIK